MQKNFCEQSAMDRMRQVLICICRVQNSERKLCALQILYIEKEYNDESNWFPKEFLQG